MSFDLRSRGMVRMALDCRSGTAAMEFGILAPIMTIFLLGMVDLSQAIIMQRKLNQVVQQTGLMATQLSIQPDQTTTLTVAQLNMASSVIFSILPALDAIVPYSTNGVAPSYAVTVSDIVFTPTSSGCEAGLTCTSYTANMAWSVPLKYGAPYMRSCGTVTQVSASASPVIVNNVPTTIPTAGISSALSSMLTVDVAYKFTPIFGRFIGSFTMRQTAYFNQRSIVSSYITYNTAGASSGGVVCTAQGYT